MRTTRRRLVLIALLLVAVAVAVPSIVGLASAGDEHSMTAVAAAATARFHDLDAANDAGYRQPVTYTAGTARNHHLSDPSESAMGVPQAALPLALDRNVNNPFKTKPLISA